MPDRDPALTLTFHLPVQAPAEEIAYVICCSPTGEAPQHTVCIIDVNPTSPTYSEIVGEFALPEVGNRPGYGSIREEVFANALRAGLTLELRESIAPNVLLARDPSRPFGFVSTGFAQHNLSSSISIWYRDGHSDATTPGALRQIIAVADEPDTPEALPGLLRSPGTVPALIADIALSPDDCFLYVACWGTGQLKQFDVSTPLLPQEVAAVRIGGIATRAAHPSHVRRLNGGPATVTVSQDGRRIYVTNALSRTWEEQFYSDGLQGWMVKLDADPCGGLAFDPNFFVDFGDRRPQRVRLPEQGVW